MKTETCSGCGRKFSWDNSAWFGGSPARGWLGPKCSDCEREENEQKRHNERLAQEERQHLELEDAHRKRLEQEERHHQERLQTQDEYRSAPASEGRYEPTGIVGTIPWSYYEANVQKAEELLADALRAQSAGHTQEASKIFSRSASLVYETIAVADCHLPAYRVLVEIAKATGNSEFRDHALKGLRGFSRAPEDRRPEARQLMRDLGASEQQLPNLRASNEQL